MSEKTERAQMLEDIRYELGKLVPNSAGNIVIPAMFNVSKGNPEEWLLMLKEDILLYLPPDSPDGTPQVMEAADEELLIMFNNFLRTVPSTTVSLEEEHDEFEELDIIEDSVRHVIVEVEDGTEDKNRLKGVDDDKASLGFCALARLSDDKNGRLLVYVSSVTGKYCPLGYFDVSNPESIELLKSDLVKIAEVIQNYVSEVK